MSYRWLVVVDYEDTDELPDIIGPFIEYERAREEQERIESILMGGTESDSIRVYVKPAMQEYEWEWE